MIQTKVMITYEDLDHKARYVARMVGVEGEGELTITKISDKIIIADHTSVPDSMRGKGAAAALVQYLIDDARSKKQRIIALCPFVRAQSMKHPEWADVFDIR